MFILIWVGSEVIILIYSLFNNFLWYKIVFRVKINLHCIHYSMVYNCDLIMFSCHRVKSSGNRFFIPIIPKFRKIFSHVSILVDQSNSWCLFIYFWINLTLTFLSIEILVLVEQYGSLNVVWYYIYISYIKAPLNCWGCSHCYI